MSNFVGCPNAVTVTADTIAVPGRLRLLALQWAHTATAGTLELKDGGASGVSRLKITTPGVASGGAGDLTIPGQGMKFDTDIYVSRGSCSGVTIIYG